MPARWPPVQLGRSAARGGPLLCSWRPEGQGWQGSLGTLISRAVSPGSPPSGLPGPNCTCQRPQRRGDPGSHCRHQASSAFAGKAHLGGVRIKHDEHQRTPLHGTVRGGCHHRDFIRRNLHPEGHTETTCFLRFLPLPLLPLLREHNTM